MTDSGGRKLGWMTSNGFRKAEFEPRAKFTDGGMVFASCIGNLPCGQTLVKHREDIVNLLL